MLETITDLDPLSLTLLAKMYFRKRIWYGSSQLSEYHKDQSKITKSLIKLYEMRILKNTDGVLFDKRNARILLESLTAQEIYDLSKEVSRFMAKYPPTTKKHYFNYKASVNSSPLIVLQPYLK